MLHATPPSACYTPHYAPSLTTPHPTGSSTSSCRPSKSQRRMAAGAPCASRYGRRASSMSRSCCAALATSRSSGPTRGRSCRCATSLSVTISTATTASTVTYTLSSLATHTATTPHHHHHSRPSHHDQHCLHPAGARHRSQAPRSQPAIADGHRGGRLRPGCRPPPQAARPAGLRRHRAMVRPPPVRRAYRVGAAAASGPGVHNDARAHRYIPSYPLTLPYNALQRLTSPYIPLHPLTSPHIALHRLTSPYIPIALPLHPRTPLHPYTTSPHNPLQACSTSSV